MKPMKLINSLFILMLICMNSCREDECIDRNQVEIHLNNMLKWYITENISLQTITDQNGISQTFTASYSEIVFDDSIEDDCGQSFESYYQNSQYTTSVSPLHFSLDINGSGIDEEATLKLNVYNTSNGGYQDNTASFNFITRKSNNAQVSFVDELTTNYRTYSDLMLIEFDKHNQSTDIKAVYIAKGYGIVKFIQQNNNTFEISSSN